MAIVNLNGIRTMGQLDEWCKTWVHMQEHFPVVRFDIIMGWPLEQLNMERTKAWYYEDYIKWLIPEVFAAIPKMAGAIRRKVAGAFANHLVEALKRNIDFRSALLDEVGRKERDILKIIGDHPPANLITLMSGATYAWNHSELLSEHFEALKKDVASGIIPPTPSMEQDLADIGARVALLKEKGL